MQLSVAFAGQMRKLSFKKVRSWYAGLVKPKHPDAPFKHIVQIGDPCLRTIADAIPSDQVQSSEIKFLIQQMQVVFRKFNCVGLSATQVGVPLRIFMMEFNEKHARSYSKQEFLNKEMGLLPTTVVINPEIKIIDYTKIVFPEACESVKGFFADVPRYKAIELKAFNEDGQVFALSAKGWLARIIQHEMDHLNGIVYTDIMDRKTLTCSCWNAINLHSGKIELPYGPD